MRAALPNRTTSVLASALAALLVAVGGETAAAADPDAEQVRARIRTILAQPEFSTKHTDKRLEYTGDTWDWGWGDEEEEEEEQSDPDTNTEAGELIGSIVTFTARSAEVLMWAAVIVLIVVAFLYRDRWLRLRMPRRRAAAAVVPQVIVGIDIRPESLPSNIPASAWALWQAGDSRGCLSLLYRGALAAMVHDRGVELPASATEGDCVRRVRRHVSSDQADFFERLTNAWQAIAYASRLPQADQARTLCDDWQAFVESPT